MPSKTPKTGARRAPRTTPAISLPMFVIDGGNADVKWQCGSVLDYFPHALAELTKSQWEAAISRYGKSDDFGFVSVDGRYYVVGSQAENFNLTKRQRRSKYTRDYYGILFASAVARTFAGDPGALDQGLRVMASHAPGDFALRSKLVDSVKGRWGFTSGGIDFRFVVTEVSTYDEQFGSYAEVAFVKNGEGYEAPLYGNSVGLIDVGGGTNGYLVVDEEGRVDQTASDSGTVGINDSLRAFKLEMESAFPDFFGQAQPNPRRLREALATGKYRGGGTVLECAPQADTALTPLMNEIQSAYIEKLQGGVGLDLIILTGGGTAILEQRLRQTLNHRAIRTAASADELRFANVRGAAKFLEVLESQV